jgi:hypothetical protein
MGFRTGFILVSVSFLTGVLFIISIYDFPLLYTEHGQTELDVAEKFYLSLFRGPTAIKALLHGMIGLGLVGLLAKLHRWTETAKWFDGVSLVLFMGCVAMYGSVQIPNLRVLADPSNVDILLRSSVRTQRETVVKARIKAGELAADTVVDLGAEAMTGDEREATLKVLAAGNTIILALLAGVLLFQASEWWIERSERIAEDKKREAEAKALGLSAAEKKGQ